MIIRWKKTDTEPGNSFKLHTIAKLLNPWICFQQIEISTVTWCKVWDYWKRFLPFLHCYDTTTAMHVTMFLVVPIENRFLEWSTPVSGADSDCKAHLLSRRFVVVSAARTRLFLFQNTHKHYVRTEICVKMDNLKSNLFFSADDYIFFATYE